VVVEQPGAVASKLRDDVAQKVRQDRTGNMGMSAAVVADEYALWNAGFVSVNFVVALTISSNAFRNVGAL
jgi:hypothetical protein